MSAERRHENPTLVADLDAIVMKATRGRVVDRYDSVDALSADLLCALESMPISAKANTFQYRASRFTRRHPSLVSFIVLALVLISAGFIAMQHEGNIARAERSQADAGIEQEAAESVHTPCKHYPCAIKNLLTNTGLPHQASCVFKTLHTQSSAKTNVF